ncbi:UDP-3-O-acyl-N-acetylglucosamine deacetylase, partial [Chroococcidiopsis sp.]|uniref:UDP-3-O-acyl-N-acetylglucosamine deacetylase n=1 Tax=Chroococcidiopsis sp. TaxID=3088168 RepID=UPI003F2A314A
MDRRQESRGAEEQRSRGENQFNIQNPHTPHPTPHTPHPTPHTPHTLAGTISQSGVGLHSGETSQVRILPAAVGEGRYFVRVDLPTQPRIPACVGAVSQTVLSTQLEA